MDPSPEVTDRSTSGPCPESPVGDQGVRRTGGRGRHRSRCRPRPTLGPSRPERGRERRRFSISLPGTCAQLRGVIEIGGVDCTMLASRHRAAMGVARTYQRTRLFGGLTVADNLYLAQTGKSGRHRALWKSAEDECLREGCGSGSEGVARQTQWMILVDDLSHGERRQLEVAMAFVTEPSILLLDEPASGLSQGERENLTQLLLGLPRELTLVLIEHDMDVALRAAERIVVMSDGKMVASGNTEEIRHDPIVHEIYLGEAGEVTDGRPTAPRSTCSRPGTASRRSSTGSPSRWEPSRWRSSGATAWGRRPCARQSWDWSDRAAGR